MDTQSRIHSPSSRFTRYAWGVVLFNIFVIIWGAFVRATGSGAGCGSHWPLCNGVVVPRAPAIETVIEFSHRVTSGIALLLVVGMLVWAWRRFPRGDKVRKAALATMILMLVEALIGAMLVRLSLVADNVSVGRALSLAIHLINTFLLLGALVLTARWSMDTRPLRWNPQQRLPWLIGIGALGTLFVGSSGAVTALGDTLLIAGTLPGGVSQPITSTAHILVQLRVFHPIIGMAVGGYSLLIAYLVTKQQSSRGVRRLAVTLVVVFFAQIIGGAINVTLLAPVWMQLVHLFMADIVWIVLVLFGAEVLADERTEPVTATVQMTPSGRLLSSR